MLISDALQARHLQSLPLLYHLDERAGLAQRVVRARVQPGETAAQRLNLQLATLQELLVHARDFQLAARRGTYRLGHLQHLVGVEIKAHDGVVRLRVRGLLLDAQAVAIAVELRNAVTLRVATQ